MNKELDNEQLSQELENEQLEIPDTLPLLPVRDVVIFPFMIAPLFVGRESSVGAVDLALNEERLIFLAAQKDITEDEPKVEDLYQFGTVCMVMRMLKLSDGRVKVLVQGLSKGKIKAIVKEDPFLYN